MLLLKIFIILIDRYLFSLIKLMIIDFDFRNMIIIKNLILDILNGQTFPFLMIIIYF